MKDDANYLKKLDDYLTLKNYSLATKKSYRCALKQFLQFSAGKNSGDFFPLELAREYILHRYKAGLKWQTINNDYSAISKFYRYVLNASWDVKMIPRPRKERALPPILSFQQVQSLIQSGRTFKHQVFMYLLYATGLRLSEALGLKLEDIDGQRLQIRVVKGKGAKDRYILMPEPLLPILRAYYRAYRPRLFLFNGRIPGSQWATRSAQWAFIHARRKAGIHRKASPHVLRHCYATHHLENGTNLVFLKEQLGHKQLKTTATYIHLCTEYQKIVKHPVANMVPTFTSNML